MREELLKCKKKLMAYAIATGMGVVSLTGCSKNDLNTGGKVNKEYFFTPSYNLHFLTLTYKDGKEKTFIVNVCENLVKTMYFIDIKTKEYVLIVDDGKPRTSIIKDYNYDENLCVRDFLLKEDNIKDEYSKEEIDEIIKDYEEYLKNTDKVLVK